MDGIHDLGGKQGYGPIPIRDNEAFHHDWEKRMWAIARCGIMPTGTIIDQFRHGLECMVPSDYLSLGYFNKWSSNFFMLYLNAGTFTIAEVLSGSTDRTGRPPASKSVNEVVTAQRAMDVDFSAPTDNQPRFAVGDTVTTKRLMPSGHTRLPAYARNATGTVIAYHGGHLLADKGAEGIHQGEHLYTVSFSATDLWGPDANAKDTVTLELWECYFV